MGKEQTGLLAALLELYVWALLRPRIHTFCMSILHKQAGAGQPRATARPFTSFRAGTCHSETGASLHAACSYPFPNDNHHHNHPNNQKLRDTNTTTTTTQNTTTTVTTIPTTKNTTTTVTKHTNTKTQARQPPKPSQQPKTHFQITMSPTSIQRQERGCLFLSERQHNNQKGISPFTRHSLFWHNC